MLKAQRTTTATRGRHVFCQGLGCAPGDRLGSAGPVPGQSELPVPDQGLEPIDHTALRVKEEPRIQLNGNKREIDMASSSDFANIPGITRQMRDGAISALDALSNIGNRALDGMARSGNQNDARISGENLQGAGRVDWPKHEWFDTAALVGDCDNGLPEQHQR